MFAIPGIIALVVFIYARPQEFFEHLQAVPLLYLFFGLALYGALVDCASAISDCAAPRNFRGFSPFSCTHRARC